MITMLLDKKNALYVKCCIIPNGVTDSQGDTLHREDIKKIFTSFNNQDNFEIYHEALPLEEVSLLENYISTANETIGTQTVPSGSWNAIVRVDNPEIQEGLLTGKLRGVSLSNRIAKECKCNLHGTIRYQDIADAECIKPVFISFVEGGANGYGLHVMDYNAYIRKSSDTIVDKIKGANTMNFSEFLDGLKSLIKQAEDTPEEEPAVKKEDTEAQEKETSEVESTTTKEEEVDETNEPAVVKKEDTTSKEEDDSTTEEKEEEAKTDVKEDDDTESNLEERVAKLEELVAELTSEKTKETEKDSTAEETKETEDETVKSTTEETEDKDTPKIIKSEKVIVENTQSEEPVNYYEMTGRDPRTGKKIRK